MAKQLDWQGNFVALSMTRDDMEACAHSGRCDEDVAATLEKPYIGLQLGALDPDDVRRELAEYGAWNDDELSDNAANRARLVWVAAGSLSDELANA